MLKNLLGNPLLLRRLVKAQERQADAIERLTKIISVHLTGSTEVLERYPELDADEDVSYATDRGSFEIREEDRRRNRSPTEE